MLSKARLKKRLDTGDARGSAIVITVGSKEEVSKLCARGLRFGGAPKVVEKYWEAGPCLVCMTCSGIGDDWLAGCNPRLEQCAICVGAYKSENDQCGVMGCTVKIEKICIYVVPKCGCCDGNHQATAFRCPVRQKAPALVWRNKGKKAEKISTSMVDERSEDRENSVKSQRDKEITPKPGDMELDIPTNWVASPGQSLDLSSIEDNTSGNGQDLWEY